MDEKLGNLYSMGWLLSACLPAYKFLHLTMVRHGSVFQVIDPWPTSWYSYWDITMPRDMVLGDTVGQAYSKGISHVGRLYVTEPGQWWWDSEQNVCYFGDPDLRLYIPNRTFSDANYWEKKDTKPVVYNENLEINGHMPFGTVGHPHERQDWDLFEKIVFAIITITILILLFATMFHKKHKKKKKNISLFLIFDTSFKIVFSAGFLKFF